MIETLINRINMYRPASLDFTARERVPQEEVEQNSPTRSSGKTENTRLHEDVSTFSTTTVD